MFALVSCYRDDRAWLNIETKVEAGAPSETAPREDFVQVTAREIRRWGLADRVTIQSFDWGTLMRWRQVMPRLPIVALTNGDFLQVGQPGASPWLGGIDVDDFGGSYVRAADSFGADALSPVHGNPQNGKVGDPGYVPYTTAAMVRGGARARDGGRAVDGRRPGDDGLADRHRRRRADHELPGPAADGGGVARAEAAEAVA